ncbi:hypothetical protein EI94DRAFT_1799579 [Lactarius quietus]|nr:hypothetical protein EI94DRAFT_1799579 [Lactarius quietus]
MSLNGYLTDEERDTAFWAGFHPNDRSTLCPHLLNYPLHFADVFSSARIAFTWEIPWLQEPQFEVSNTRDEPADFLEPTSMPLPTPIHSTATLPSPISSPEVCCPVSAPPAPRFKDPGEGDLHSHQVDRGLLISTQHGSHACETLQPLPSPPHDPPPSSTHSPSLFLPAPLPLLPKLSLLPLPSPILPIRPSPLPELPDTPSFSFSDIIPPSRLPSPSISSPIPSLSPPLLVSPACAFALFSADRSLIVACAILLISSVTPLSPVHAPSLSPSLSHLVPPLAHSPRPSDLLPSVPPSSLLPATATSPPTPNVLFTLPSQPFKCALILPFDPLSPFPSPPLSYTSPISLPLPPP